MKRRVLYLVAAVVIVIAGYFVWRSTLQSMRKFDPRDVSDRRDRLVSHNARFLGRDRAAARYKVDVTGKRGLTCFAYYRIPVAERKLPALLLLYSNPGRLDIPALLNEVERANELAVLAVNVDSCFGAATRDERSVFDAAQLCLDYLDKHFSVDTNRVFVGGLDNGNLYALPVSALDTDRLAGVILHLPPDVRAGSGLRSAARWGNQSVRDKLLVVLPGSAADGALANWTQTAGNLPICDKRRAQSAIPAALLTESVDWILGPRADSTASPPATAPVTLEELKSKSLPLQRK